MRRAFIGLSSPLAYCYKKQAGGDSSPPNPILEDSLGLIILYDELVFLTPELCPANMRALPYVKFLSRRSDYIETMSSVLAAAQQKYKINDQRDPSFGNPFVHYRPALEQVTGQPFRYNPSASRFVPDNHGRRFEVAPGLSACGSSTWLQNVIADWTAVEQFGLLDCEVVSNSGNSIYYASIAPHDEPRQARRAVGHALVLRGLPNYLDSEGPYHPCLEELRNHQFVEDARAHIDEVTSQGTEREVREIADEILRTANDIRQKVFARFLQRHNEYAVIAKAGLKEGLGLLVPGVGLLGDLIEARETERTAQALRWAGFVAELGDGQWAGGRP